MQENKSQNAIKVIDRLKTLLKISTDIELSAFLNVKPNTVSTWKKRNSLDYESIISICELYELDLNKVFLDKKSEQSASNNTPLIMREVQYQYVSSNDMSLLEILPKYNFPFLTNSNSRAFQVQSNNMFPVIEENSFVLCDFIDVNDIVNDTLVVVISRTKGLFINKVSTIPENENVLILSNENDFYNDIILNKSEITEVWKISGVLSYDINNDNKIKFISDSIAKINRFLDGKTIRYDIK